MKSGKFLESYVQFVYQKLLEFLDEGASVSTNLLIQGKSGVKHEFDVYYEFQHLNIKHRIAIECKEWNTPVTKGEVGEFVAKLNDLNNISGVMVAKSGYQSGARQFAEANGIQLMEEKDLPSFTDIIAGVVKKAFLPDKKLKAILLDTDGNTNGETTGTYYALADKEKTIVPFFYSQVIAEKLRKKLPDGYCYEVRGVSQYQLKGFIAQMEVLGVQAAIYYVPFWNEDEIDIPFAIIPIEKLKEEYVYI